MTEPTTKTEQQETQVFHVVKGKDGGVIARTEGGKIALFNSKNPITPSVKIGEDWKCKILFEKEKFIVIDPVDLDVSISENDKKVLDKADKLIEKFNKKK